MTNSRSAVLLVALVFLGAPRTNPAAQKAGTNPKVLSLNFRNNGQHVLAKVGQQIEISFGSMAPCDPQVSSPAIRLESVALTWPPNPGFGHRTYIFDAAAEGEAEIRLLSTSCSDPNPPETTIFRVTISVGPATGGRSTPYASSTLDQANTTPWDNAWTNLLNDVRQTFTPSLPRLTAVEVQLVAANPGPASSEVTMNLLNPKGEIVSVVSKSVPADDYDHVLFVFPNGGLQVSPGQVYTIQLSGGSRFGWKYVVGGYTKGSASFNGKPLLWPDTRSTFLFRTFGAT
jgi:hypothetical protein